MIGAEGEQLGIMSVPEALKIAEEQELDLVEIAPNPDLPVCRIMDYGKFQFKKGKEQKKQKKVQLKEIKFRPATDEGDYQVKLRKLREFLEGGHKAKVTMRFRGREIAHQELGLELLNRVKTDLLDSGIVEQFPKLEGKQMVMLLSPKKAGS